MIFVANQTPLLNVAPKAQTASDVVRAGKNLLLINP
ncbi:hypothetical protein M2321_003605 [Rhodoblastus acidophilus]|nr:hypothetical protein [Rhodoblastus acidophilus]